MMEKNTKGLPEELNKSRDRNFTCLSEGAVSYPKPISAKDCKKLIVSVSARRQHGFLSL